MNAATPTTELSSSPLVSAIITTYSLDRLPDIQDVIRSLNRQTYSNVEVIFVGERTTELCDKIESFAAELGMNNFMVLFNDGVLGLSPARNLGVSRSHGEIIAFTDDHAVVEDDWIEEIVREFREKPAAIGVTGPAIPAWEDEEMAWFPEEFYWVISSTSKASRTKSRIVRNPWGVNMAYRRDVFDVCVFSEDFGVSNKGNSSGTKMGLVGDDTEFGVRASMTTGRPIVFAPSVRVQNKVRRHKLTKHFIRRRAFWEGYTKATLRQNTKRAGKNQEGFPLSTESAALRHLFTSYFPAAIVQSVIRPSAGLRNAALGLDVLAHVGMGYLAGLTPKRLRFVARRYS